MTDLPAPERTLRGIVCVPARDEEARIAACIQALGEQRGVTHADYEVLLVLHRCEDGTRQRAFEAALRFPDLAVHVLTCDHGGVGHARKLAMDTAWERFQAIDCPNGLIVSTDADSRADPEWLGRQLAMVEGGVSAIGGRIDLDPSEMKRLSPGAVRTRRSQAAARMADVRLRSDPSMTDHHFFSGASLALTASAYGRVGGLPPVEALEDEALQRRLERHGIAIARPDGVRVATSARTVGRAPRGLAIDLAVTDWRQRRTFDAADFSVDDLVSARRDTISVVLPAREVAETIGAIIDALQRLRNAGLIDEVVVMDAASVDGTAKVAAAHGAQVVQENDVLPEFGAALGKGDAMWRALAVTTGDIVCYVDADTEAFSERFVVGLIGPLIQDPSLSFVKGAFLRPYRSGNRLAAGEGGRVTELVARPLLNLYEPRLAAFDQPLAGELSARRELLEGLAFPGGYGVEIAMLIDVERTVGLDAMAQVDLGERLNRHQTLRELGAMAYAVMVAAGNRLLPDAGEGRHVPGPFLSPPLAGPMAPMEVRAVPVEERPPMRDVAARSGQPWKSPGPDETGATVRAEPRRGATRRG